MVVQATRTFFYEPSLTITATAFTSAPDLRFPFTANRVILSNDSDTNIVTFSFLAPNIDGELFCTDGPIVFDWLNQDRLWFKVNSGDAKIRIWAWRL